MTLQTILKRLLAIDREAQTLINETGFDYDDGFGDQVCLDRNDANAHFLRDCLELCMSSFVTFHEDVHFITTPVHGEYSLTILPEGRCGYFDEYGRANTLPCGSVLEAKIPDENGQLHWVRTRIEHDGNDYYLVNYNSVPLIGLVIRERW